MPEILVTLEHQLRGLYLQRKVNAPMFPAIPPSVSTFAKHVSRSINAACSKSHKLAYATGVSANLVISKTHNPSATSHDGYVSYLTCFEEATEK